MISYGISEMAVIPVRMEPSDKSEMVTQVLFGETFKITEEKNNWVFIEIIHDGYRGWIDKKLLSYSNPDYIDCSVNEPFIILSEVFTEITEKQTSEIIRIPFGSTLPCFNKEKNEFRINSTIYKLKNPGIVNNKNILSNANKLLNTPYLWGGKNPCGIDCSGFVQVVYKTATIFLPRDASKQAEIGTTIDFVNNITPGDLAFFDNDEGQIIHTGILLSEKKIIHASGKVRIDTFDHQGIYNEKQQKYTHKLRIIKRII